MKHRILSFLSAAALTAAAVPFTAVNADSEKTMSFTYEVQGENAVIVGINGYEKNLVIPQTIDGLTVTAIADNTLMGAEDIESLVIPDSVVSIGERSFSACPELTDVTIGTGLNTLGDYSFSACPKLKSITVAAKNSSFSSVNGCLAKDKGSSLLVYAGDNNAVIPESVKTIGKAAFLGKTALLSVDIPDSVTALGDFAFSGCTSLKSLDIPDSVKNIGKSCFMSCSNLKKVRLSEQLKSINTNTFNACSALTYITIPASTQTIGDNAFFGCTELYGLYIPETVTQIGDQAIGFHYSIRTGAVENITNFSLHGEKGSAAEKYAGSSGIELRPFILGDVDDDGSVDGSDAAIALREYSLIASELDGELNAFGVMAADCDNSGDVDGSDASIILKMYAEAGMSAEK